MPISGSYQPVCNMTDISDIQSKLEIYLSYVQVNEG